MISRNKKMASTFLPLLCLSFAATFNIAHAETIRGTSQTLSITGEIQGGGCTVNFPTTITFPDADINTLPISTAATANNMIAPTGSLPELTIDSCAASQQFTLTLIGDTDPNDASVLLNPSDGESAENVGMLMLLTGANAGEVLKPGTPSTAMIAGNDGSYAIELQPGLVKTTATPTAGSVHITGQIQVNYL